MTNIIIGLDGWGSVSVNWGGGGWGSSALPAGAGAAAAVSVSVSAVATAATAAGHASPPVYTIPLIGAFAVCGVEPLAHSSWSPVGPVTETWTPVSTPSGNWQTI